MDDGQRLTGLEALHAGGQTPLLPIFSGSGGIEIGSNDGRCYGDAAAAAVLALADPDPTTTTDPSA